MRLALIANPASGRGLVLSELSEALEARGARVDAFAISDAAEISMHERYDRLVVAGGDGSIGLAAERAGQLGIPLAVIPTGTANDFARAHDLPLGVDDAVALAATGKALARLELGRLGERPFVNVASAGLAPDAARHAQGYKKALGPLAYVVGAARAGLGSQPVECCVTVDGEPLYEGESWQLIVSVSGAFGGGSEIDEADPGDGLLHVTVVPSGSRFKLAWRALGMRRGDLPDQDGVLDAEGRQVELGLAPDAQLNVDGEVCTPAPLSVQPRAFSLVVG